MESSSSVVGWRALSTMNTCKILTVPVELPAGKMPVQRLSASCAAGRDGTAGAGNVPVKGTPIGPTGM